MNEEKKFNVALEFRQQTLMNAEYRFLLILISLHKEVLDTGDSY